MLSRLTRGAIVVPGCEIHTDMRIYDGGLSHISDVQLPRASVHGYRACNPIPVSGVQSSHVLISGWLQRGSPAVKNSIDVVDIATGNVTLSIQETHNDRKIYDSIPLLSVPSDEEYPLIVSTGDDARLRLWKGGTEIFKYCLPYAPRITALGEIAELKTLVACASNFGGSNRDAGKVSLLDIEKATELVNFPVLSSGTDSCDVVGTEVFVGGCTDKMVAVFDARSVSRRYPVLDSVQFESHVRCVCAVPETGSLFVLLGDATVCRHDLRFLKRRVFVAKVYETKFIRRAGLCGIGGGLCVCAAESGTALWKTSDGTVKARDDDWKACGVGFIPPESYSSFGVLPEVVSDRYSLFFSEEGEKFLQFTLRQGDSNISLCRTFLVDSVRSEELNGVYEAESEVAGIEQELVNQILLGTVDSISHSELINIFALFEELGLKRHSYLICKCLELVPTVEEVLSLLREAVGRFSESFEDGNVGSPFVLSLLNRLTDFDLANDELQREIGEIGAAEVVGILQQEKKLIQEHECFAMVEDFPQSFAALSSQILRTLYQNPRFVDVTLKVKEREFPVHLIVLVRNSKFFHQMLNFPGTEAKMLREERVIQIADEAIEDGVLLNGDVSMESLLEWIYTKELSTTDLKVLLAILHHAQVIDQSDLKRDVRERIVVASKDLTEPDIDRVIIPIYHFMTECPNVFRVVRNIWVAELRILNDDLLSAAIARADQQMRIQEVFKVVDENMATMEARMAILEAAAGEGEEEGETTDSHKQLEERLVLHEASTNERFDRLENSLGSMDERMGKIEAAVGSILERLTEIEEAEVIYEEVEEVEEEQ